MQINKIIISAVLAAVLLAAFPVSCSKNDKDENINEENTVGNEDNQSFPEMSELAKKLTDDFDFPDMYVLPEDQIEAEFGVIPSDFSDICAVTTAEYPGIERIFLGVIAEESSKHISDIEERLNNYLEMLKAEYIDYIPSEYKKSKNAEVYTDGSFVALVICDDCKKALDTLQASIE